MDIRTSSFMGVLARPDGEAVAAPEQPHELSLPHAGWAEHKATEVWWKDFVASCPALLEKADVPIAAVLAVAGARARHVGPGEPI